MHRTLSAIALAVFTPAGLFGCDVLLGIADVPTPLEASATSGSGSTSGSSGSTAPVEGSTAPCDTQNDMHNCGQCGHDCLGGQCLAGVCQARALVDIDAGFSPRDLAQDGDYLYWTDSLGSVNRTNKVTGATTLAHDDPGPTGIAVDDAGLYWGDYVGLWTCPKATCSANVLPVLVAHAPAGVFSLTIDDRNIYWSEESTNLFEAPKDGIDAGGSTLWSSGSAGTSINYLTTDGQRVYFTADDGMLHMVSVDGGQPMAIGAAGPSSSEGIALQDGVVYWTVLDPSAGQVNSASTTSLRVTTFEGTLPSPLAVASDSVSVYWADNPSEGDKTAEIHQCAVASCSPVVIAHAYFPRAIVVDDNAVYWTDSQSVTGFNGSLWKIAK